MLKCALERGRTLNARLQVRGFDAIAQLVEAGLGVAVLPATTASRFSRLFAVRMIALSEPWAKRDYLLATRVHDTLPAAVQRFVDALCPPVIAANSPRIRGEPRHRKGLIHDRTHPLRQALGRPRPPHRGRWHRAAVHRPPPAARSHEPAGVRRPRHRRPQGLATVGQPGGQRPQRADDRPPRRHHRPDSKLQVDTLDANCDRPRRDRSSR
jgi:hypothetical protein